MTIVNMHEAKTHLSRLVDRVADGETIIIARSGKPVAQLTQLPEASATEHRLGFLRGAFHVPDDFDRLGEDEIAAEFGSQR